MADFRVSNPNYRAEIGKIIEYQKIMATIGAELVSVEPGQVQLGLPYRADLTQHHGYLHAGIVTTIVDSACGAAAYSLMPVGSGVLTVEYKVNFLAPAKGDYMLATGQVIKPGRTLTFCEGRVIAKQGDEEKLIVTMQATMMCLPQA